MVCGVPHWLTEVTKHIDNIDGMGIYSVETTEIVYFDIEKEEKQIRSLELPVKVEGGKYKLVGIGALNGQTQLGIVLKLSYCFDFEVWVMKEYGKTESWTKFCVITLENMITKDHLLSLNLLGFMPNGELLICTKKGRVKTGWPVVGWPFVYYQEWFVYDIAIGGRGGLRRVKLCGDWHKLSDFQVIAYEPSVRETTTAPRSTI